MNLDFLGVVIFAGVLLVGLIVIITFITVGILVIKALIKYIKSGDVRKEKSIIRKSLGEVLKQRRTDCNMTQEFVAEAIGVSRQAVSKWENGTSDPSTSNLIALAKLFKISAEELLQEVH
ncbi:MAG: helix-turn-helix domain-containing protein [Cellulosilyticaceae bacterium]